MSANSSGTFDAMLCLEAAVSIQENRLIIPQIHLIELTTIAAIRVSSELMICGHFHLF